jgi:hypothetical protein
MEPFISPSDGTSSSDASEIDAVLPSVNAGRKRRRTLQGKSTTKDTRPRRVAVYESSDTESQDSQGDEAIGRRTAAGRRRRHLGAHPQRWDRREDRYNLTHLESNRSSEDGQHVVDGEVDKPEVTVRRHRRSPSEAFEEDILRKYAGRKSGAEIAKELKRSPNGVSQHWRLMQDMRGPYHTSQPNRKRKRKRRKEAAM